MGGRRRGGLEGRDRVQDVGVRHLDLPQVGHLHGDDLLDAHGRVLLLAPLAEREVGVHGVVGALLARPALAVRARVDLAPLRALVVSSADDRDECLGTAAGRNAPTAAANKARRAMRIVFLTLKKILRADGGD
eukprot:CAMPEP_0119259922 /NCGR_PEP_ID=MMETSP1329-20130426/546_1 /TAXON_ID=114041 /ORGANISM="Genus nov. species nov., Strain RCC1024" /LENGTH=132 /DNA_ID=CAMNT_0007259331 /DNA_START=28 /DNA_END=427 /DNA_ORIENTATION=+